MLLRGRVIYRKMLKKAFSTKNGKACCRNFLKKKTITGVSINNNNSTGTIIGQLVQKQVCDQKLRQKLVSDRKASGTEKVNHRNCVKTKKGL